MTTRELKDWYREKKADLKFWWAVKIKRQRFFTYAGQFQVSDLVAREDHNVEHEVRRLLEREYWETCRKVQKYLVPFSTMTISQKHEPWSDRTTFVWKADFESRSVPKPTWWRGVLGRLT